jgi:BMFP domain-containing protein YqiC
MGEFGKDRADVRRDDREAVNRVDMVHENAINAGEELRKRRSSRIVQAVPLMVTGVDALGRPFVERTSSLIINCHGCRYQSKHYVLKNMWVTLEIPHPETGQPPRKVRARVAWIQRPRTVRQLFQVALELELPGNVWGIGFPPEDWAHLAPTATFPVGKSEENIVALPEHLAEAPASSVEHELPPAAIGTDTLHVLPPIASTTDASLQLARQVARLIADARQQISTAAREAGAQAVAAEQRATSEQWEHKLSGAREEILNEASGAVERVRHESEVRSKAAYSAAAKALQDELPKWLTPHLEGLTRDLTASISRAGGEQRALHDQHVAGITERVQQLCREAEEIARHIVNQSQEAERRIAEQASVTSAVLDSRARKQEEAFGAQQEKLNASAGAAQQQLTDAVASAQGELEKRLADQVESGRAQIQEFVDAAVAKLTAGMTETASHSAEQLRTQIRERLGGEIEERIGALREAGNVTVSETEQRLNSLRGALHEHSGRLDGAITRAGETASQLEQMSSRLGTTQQLALEAFQSQLDDVLTIHRNELHRRSETLFEELNARIHRSFNDASQDAVNKFDEQIRNLVEPHINETNEAIGRLAGGRSLLDASLTLQQERIRAAADDAFAESLARFRENLGGVEQLLHEASQGVISRNVADLEQKAGDVRHRAGEEIYKTAEWYEKKVQTQLNGLSERMVEQAGNQLRERAGEVSAEFGAELDHSSRSFVGHTQNQMKEVVRESFDRARELFAEAADTTTAAFMDEIQRQARQELAGFTETVKQSAVESERQFAASREVLAQRLSAEQESFLQRFQAGMANALDNGVREAQEKINDGFLPIWESWKAMTEKQQQELRASMAELSDTATGEFKSRLDNVSNTWLLTTVAKLDHQSREVVTGLSATAQEKLRAACADVFYNVGESLRKRLQEITAEFSKTSSPESK